MARVTIEKFWARSGRELGKKRAITFTNIDRGTVDFRHTGVQVSRINTEVYGESILEIFACFTVKTCLQEKYEHIYLAQS
jgi:hypothetical protein